MLSNNREEEVIVHNNNLNYAVSSKLLKTREDENGY